MKTNRTDSAKNFPQPEGKFGKNRQQLADDLIFDEFFPIHWGLYIQIINCRGNAN